MTESLFFLNLTLFFNPVVTVANGFVMSLSWWRAEVIMDTVQTPSGLFYSDVFFCFYHPRRSAKSEAHTHTLSQGNAAWPVWEVCFLYPSCLTTSPLVFKLAPSFQTRRHCSAAIVPLRLAADSFVVKFTLPEVAKPFTLQDLLSATANDDCAACRVRHFLKGKMYILLL